MKPSVKGSGSKIENVDEVDELCTHFPFEITYPDGHSLKHVSEKRKKFGEQVATHSFCV